MDSDFLLKDTEINQMLMKEINNGAEKKKSTPPQNENLDSKIRHLQASELKFYDVRRA